MAGNVPKIRFPGFTEPWEQRKLGELATMNARIGWQNLRTSEFKDQGDYLLITGTDFKDGKIDYANAKYVEANRYDQDPKIQLHEDSILITKDGTLGKVAYVKDLPFPATLNAGVFNVRVKDNRKIFPEFLFNYVNGPFLMEYVAERSTGGTIKHLNQSVLIDLPIPIPSIREQRKISDFLCDLTSIITLHQRKLDDLKKFKSGLLQKMFPKAGETVPEVRFPEFTGDWEQRKLGDYIHEQRERTTFEDEDRLISCAINGIFLNSELFSHFRGKSNIGYLKILIDYQAQLMAYHT